jgi:hypothetical protein
MRYHSAMSQEPESPEYRNFTNLLRRIVTVPHAEIRQRMEDEEARTEWSKTSDQGGARHRPIVSPAAVSSSKNKP